MAQMLQLNDLSLLIRWTSFEGIIKRLPKYLVTNFRLVVRNILYVLKCTLACVSGLSTVTAIEVTIPEVRYEFARGDNITLPCSFTTKVSAPKPIVTWTVEGEENEEITILTYYSMIDSLDVKGVYEGRVGLDHDIAKGRVNLKLNNIMLSENKPFECKVQIPGDKEGKVSDTTTLLVLVAPSPPICKMQGKAEYGQNINLTCVSEEGSPPPSYNWEGHDVRNTLRQLPQTAKQKDGVLSLFNISMETSGYYICTSANKIRQATCNITLSVMPPSMNVGSTAGIIGGAVGLLIFLFIIIYCCCCRKKKGDEEYEMGVPQEDYHDRAPTKERVDDNEEKEPRDRTIDRHDRPSERSDYDADGQSDYSRRDDRYDDGYNDRRDNHRNDRRDGYDDRRDDRRDRYDDRYDRYDRRNRSDERDRPPSVPPNKPSRADYD
ncbi:hypothetical protein ACEWY4_016907 [Coilia grayii]|uniref:Ig-like domain-containing protein n=1 Tax=Coilia grayii TaxID=363190 RepID=A0ABD1JLZ3_9TELE